jgi:alpha-beta hydrolase superfamily lysophospholipase
MPSTLRAAFWIVPIVVIAFLLVEASSRIPAMAANGLLRPHRRATQNVTPESCEAATFSGAGVMLKGWRCRASGRPRGTIIYLHGVADNRGSASSIIQRYTAKGFDVIAYDSRAHGDSEGSICTYGYFEKDDLRRIVDLIEHRPIVLMGNSLGAAVAIQAAAGDTRIAAVVAAETFSDLRTVASERAPWVLTDDIMARAFQLAEQSGRFEVDAVSPERAARKIHAPVLLIHGTDDRETPASHSQRVMSALAGPKRLILVDGAGHNESLRQEKIWAEIDRWVEDVVNSI